MTTVDRPRSRAESGNPEPSLDTPVVTKRVPDWVRRQRRQERRLRRTVLLLVAVLIAGAIVARWREDVGTVLAAGTRPATAVLVPADEVSTGLGVSPPDATSSAGSAVPGSDATNSTATPHADSEEPPSSEPAPAAAQQPVPSAGSGELSAVEIPDGPNKPTGRTVAFGIDIEDGLPVSAAEFASVVETVLLDSRGWQTKDDVRFVPVGPSERASGSHVDILLTLASPTLTAKLCAPLNTSVQQVSCWNGSRAVLNLTRWIRGATTYGEDLISYRDYLVSHEVGHGLGHGHVNCPAAGAPAPVMVQQTKDLEGCTAWPWPTNR
jgi:hypothetical protein